MEKAKEVVNWLLGLGRPLAVKVIVRAVGYGLTAWFGVSAANAQDPATKAAEAVYAAVAFLAMALLDRWNHKDARGEQPK